MSTLTVKLSGEGVLRGKISVDDLQLVLQAVSTSLERFAERGFEPGPSLRRGPRLREARARTRLVLSGLAAGSTELVFESGSLQTDLSGRRIGAETLREWVDGTRTLADPSAFLDCLTQLEGS
jgi:hypothetical protein